MKQRILSVVLVLLLVTGSGLSPVGTALAAEQGDCGNLDDFVMFLTLGAVNAEDCSRTAYVEDAVQDMKDSQDNQTEVDIYSAASGQKAGTKAWMAPYDNYLNDTESVAWMKVEKAVAEAYENGSTEAEAKVAAREAISDYYATKQINLIEQWNTTIKQYDYLDERETTENLSESFVHANMSYSTSTDEVNTIEAQANFTDLVNGSQHDAFEVVHPTSPDRGYKIEGSYNYGPLQDGDSSGNHYRVELEPPNDNYDELQTKGIETYQARWERIEEMNSQLQSEAENFVNATWDDFDSGTINASDVISSHTAMFEYGVRSGNESEGLYRSIGALALMGYDTPNVTDSGTMTVQYNGQNYTGLIMAQNAPGGSWEVGKTYDTANISGPVFMATTDGTKVDFNGTFEITGMTSKDGSQVNSTQTTKYVYKTADTNELLALQEDLSDLRQELEDRETSGGGSSGSGSGLSQKQMAIGVAALAAVALLIGGGNRRD